MTRKLDLITNITLERSDEDIIIKSDRKFYWKTPNVSPEVAVTAVVSNTLCKALRYEDYFSGKFTIRMKIEHEDDE